MLGIAPAASAQGIASGPYMGWNSFYAGFGAETIHCNEATAPWTDANPANPTCLDTQNIKETADAMAADGLGQAGYKYIWIDAGWWDGTRCDHRGCASCGVPGSASNRICADPSSTVDAAGPKFRAQWPTPDPVKYPLSRYGGNGLAALIAYIHQRDHLKIGLYTDAGPHACGTTSNVGGSGPWWPGGVNHYRVDANTFVRWGVDAVKIDWCGGYQRSLSPQAQYTQFARAIFTASRDCAETRPCTPFSHPMLVLFCNFNSPDAERPPSPPADRATASTPGTDVRNYATCSAQGCSGTAPWAGWSAWWSYAFASLQGRALVAASHGNVAIGWRTETDIDTTCVTDVFNRAALGFQNSSPCNSPEYNWGNLTRAVAADTRVPQAQAPGAWQDPDAIGPDPGQWGPASGPCGQIRADEVTSQITMWAMLGAPLIIGSDVRNGEDGPGSAVNPDIASGLFNIRATLENRGVIAIDQDPLGREAELLASAPNGVEVWMKRLDGRGTRAVAFLNTTGGTQSVPNVTAAQLGLSGSPAWVNVWSARNLGAAASSQTVTGSHLCPYQALLYRATGSESSPLSNGWQPLNKSARSPALVWQTVGRGQAKELDAFARSGNDVWWNIRCPPHGRSAVGKRCHPDSWLGWRRVPQRYGNPGSGGLWPGGLAAAAWGPGHVELFSTGASGDLWRLPIVNDSVAGHWQRTSPPRGWTLASSPAATSQVPGELDVVLLARSRSGFQLLRANWGGTVGRGRHRRQSHRWVWTAIGTGGPVEGSLEGIQGDPSVASTRPGELDVAVRGFDDGVYVLHCASCGTPGARWPVQPAWSTVAPGVGPAGVGTILPGPLSGHWTISSNPVIVSESRHTLDLFARGPAQDGLWEARRTEGVWSSTWHPICGAVGGVITGSPGASAYGPGRTDLIAIGIDGYLYTRAFSDPSARPYPSAPAAGGPGFGCPP